MRLFDIDTAPSDFPPCIKLTARVPVLGLWLVGVLCFGWCAWQLCIDRVHVLG